MKPMPGRRLRFREIGCDAMFDPPAAGLQVIVFVGVAPRCIQSAIDLANGRSYPAGGIGAQKNSAWYDRRDGSVYRYPISRPSQRFSSIVIGCRLVDAPMEITSVAGPVGTATSSCSTTRSGPTLERPKTLP